MQFEILSEISNVETFATARAYGKLRDSGDFMAVVAGASVKASPACDYLMARFISQSYTGTKLPGLDARNSRSSISFDP